MEAAGIENAAASARIVQLQELSLPQGGVRVECSALILAATVGASVLLPITLRTLQAERLDRPERVVGT